MLVARVVGVHCNRRIAELEDALAETQRLLAKATEEARYACDQRNLLEQALVDMTEERDMADAYIRTIEARG